MNTILILIIIGAGIFLVWAIMSANGLKFDLKKLNFNWKNKKSAETKYKEKQSKVSTKDTKPKKTNYDKVSLQKEYDQSKSEIKEEIKRISLPQIVNPSGKKVEKVTIDDFQKSNIILPEKKNNKEETEKQVSSPLKSSSSSFSPLKSKNKDYDFDDSFLFEDDDIDDLFEDPEIAKLLSDNNSKFGSDNDSKPISTVASTSKKSNNSPKFESNDNLSDIFDYDFDQERYPFSTTNSSFNSIQKKSPIADRYKDVYGNKIETPIGTIGAKEIIVGDLISESVARKKKRSKNDRLKKFM